MGCRADLVVLGADVFAAGKAALDRGLVAGRTVVAEGRHCGREAIAACCAATVARLAA